MSTASDSPATPDPTARSSWAGSGGSAARLGAAVEVVLLMVLFFVYAGDPPPAINEAHYLVKAKNFWQPEWCARDLFVASAKAHTTFYVLFGWPTQFVSLTATAWAGRIVGWLMLAVGLQRLSWKLLPRRGAVLGVATVWLAGIEYGNLAGEWVVGGIEAKVPAYGLVLLALAELTDRRYSRVWPLLGAASALHVLVGGWSVLAAGLVWWMDERRRADAQPLLTPALAVGGALALFGLVPALWLTLGTSAEDSLAAARIYTYFRIAHHLLPAAFDASWYLRHGALVLATGLAAWAFRHRWHGSWKRIGWFVTGAVAIALAGLLVGLLPLWAPDWAARLLRYYWFRLTDVSVPLLFALLVLRLFLEKGTGEFLPAGKRFLTPFLRVVAAGVLVVAVVLVSLSSAGRIRLGVPPSVSNRVLGGQADVSRQRQQEVFADWRAVCRWARAATPPEEIFLTPRHQQTFKWYAHRAEVVNWKDVPQDAASLLQWSDRFAEIFPRRLGTMRVSIRYDLLRQYRRRYGVRYMLVDRRVTGANLPLVRVYPRGAEENETYAVYRLPE